MKKNLDINPINLKEYYHIQNMSLEDIGKHYECSKVTIYQLFKKFEIPLRTKSQSRELVYSQGKIKVNRIYNRKLFKVWTPKMAYVLGLLYTDGSIGYTQGKNTLYKSFSFSQTDISFFNQVCKLLSFSGTTYTNKETNCNIVSISNIEMVEDLEKLGLYPNKSLTLKFPDIPIKFLSHFIRGIFDGDGSRIKGKGKISKITITSGSKSFIYPLSEVLLNNDIYNKVYSYKYHTLTIARKSEIDKFYKFIYKNKKGMYFKKKYNKFKMYYQKTSVRNVLKKSYR